MTPLPRTISSEEGFSAFVRNHPLIAYFILAYAGMWTVSGAGTGAASRIDQP